MTTIASLFASASLGVAVAFAAPLARAATLNAPAGMAVDGAGNLYVANEGANTVTIYDTAYTLTKQITSGLNAPTSVAVAPSGTIYVANSYGNDVTMYSAALQPEGTLPYGNFTMPLMVVTDQVNEVWVLDSTGAVSAFTSNGQFVGGITQAGATALVLSQGLLQLWGAPAAGGTSFLAGDAGVIAHGEAVVAAGATVSIARVGGAAANGPTSVFVSDDSNGVVDEISVVSGTLATTARIKPPFMPFGVAVDQAHDRLFISGGPFANRVAVYTLQPPFKLLHVIQ